MAKTRPTDYIVAAAYYCVPREQVTETMLRHAKAWRLYNEYPKGDPVAIEAIQEYYLALGTQVLVGGPELEF